MRVAHIAALAAMLIMAIAGLWLFLQLRASEFAHFQDEARRQALVVVSSPELIQSWQAGADTLRPELAHLSSILNAKITALTLQGEVLAQSHTGGPATDWRNLPEVRTALNGREGTSTHQVEDTLRQEFNVALPVYVTPELSGVLLFAFSQQDLQTKLAEFNQIVLLVTLVVILFLVMLNIGVTESLTYGVRRMTQVVERITTSDLNERIYPVRNADLSALARAINQMADKLQSQMKKRAREKDRLTTVMHVMTDGVIILNRYGVVKLINNAAARMLNTTGEKAMHRTFVQTVRDHRIAEVWKRCQASGEQEVAAIELGVTQFMRVAVTPFLGRAGRGYLVMLQDLTQVRRLQTVRQDFISNVSHELRTPLASLRALAETLRDSALDDPPAASRFLDRMEVEVDALTQMVEELLELSRIESGQVPLRLNPVMPYAAISPAVDRLRAQAERGQLTLELNVSRDLPLVLVDAGRIHQVVTNIVHNAIKFTPPEGNIMVSASADATKVTVAVTDTGIGIASNDVSRIFERFYKTDRSRAVGGTGLGLAIAKHIVQAHGGAIWAISQEGKGSTFYFTMPRAEPEAQIEPSADEVKGEVNPSIAPTIPTNVPLKSMGSSTRYG